MTKTKAKVSPTFNYPPENHRRDGCKVSWLYYKKRTDAKLASDVAKLEAVYLEAQGYDFGYCAPGTIEKIEPGLKDEKLWGPVTGMYEVCVP